ncbi:hypothetical protein LXA43DRAFT_92314 [Ganoderma leucocontextum]|nr:hypothetical protein LXA43DRAFT_92314 [Ganoderma leucocontextum]
MGSNHIDGKQPALAIPPRQRLLDAVAHLETPASPDPMNTATAAAPVSGEIKPFRAPTGDIACPYKSSSKTPKSSHSETVQVFQRKRQKQKNVRLNSPLPGLPVSDPDLDGLVGGMGRLTLADDPVQASPAAEDGFNISAAAAPDRSSSIFSLPYSISAHTDDKSGKEKGAVVEVEEEDVAVVSGQGPPSRSPRCPDNMPLGNLVSACSPPFRPIHTTPVRRSSIPTATTASATDPSSASRPCLTAVAVSLVYEVFASPDDEADEIRTWYPIGGGTLNVAATGRGLTLGATVEV